VAKGINVVGSLEQALTAAGDVDDEAFLIGGESIFEEGLKLAGTVYLTRVLADIEGDRFFHFKPDGWELISSEKHAADEKNQYGFEFQEWRRSD
jgi:dihydrofolate reductase